MVAVGKFLHFCSLNPLSAREKLIRAYIGVTLIDENHKNQILSLIESPRYIPLPAVFGLRNMAYATSGKLETSTVLDQEKCREFSR